MAAIPEETLEYWKERVAGAASLQLPSDYPTPDNAQVMYRAIIEGAIFLVTIWKMWCCHPPPKKKKKTKTTSGRRRHCLACMHACAMMVDECSFSVLFAWL